MLLLYVIALMNATYVVQGSLRSEAFVSDFMFFTTVFLRLFFTGRGKSYFCFVVFLDKDAPVNFWYISLDPSLAGLGQGCFLQPIPRLGQVA